MNVSNGAPKSAKSVRDRSLSGNREGQLSQLMQQGRPSQPMVLMGEVHEGICGTHQSTLKVK